MIRWQSFSGESYDIGYSTNLVGADWLIIRSNIPGMPTSAAYTDDVERVPPVFYRIGLE